MINEIAMSRLLLSEVARRPSPIRCERHGLRPHFQSPWLTCCLAMAAIGFLNREVIHEQHDVFEGSPGGTVDEVAQAREPLSRAHAPFLWVDGLLCRQCRTSRTFAYRNRRYRSLRDGERCILLSVRG